MFRDSYLVALYTIRCVDTISMKGDEKILPNVSSLCRMPWRAVARPRAGHQTQRSSLTFANL